MFQDPHIPLNVVQLEVLWAYASMIAKNFKFRMHLTITWSVQSVWGARTILEKWREAKNDRLGSNLKENDNPKPQTQNLPDTPLRNLRQKAAGCDSCQTQVSICSTRTSIWPYTSRGSLESSHAFSWISQEGEAEHQFAFNQIISSGCVQWLIQTMQLTLIIESPWADWEVPYHGTARSSPLWIWAAAEQSTLQEVSTVPKRSGVSSRLLRKY